MKTRRQRLVLAALSLTALLLLAGIIACLRFLEPSYQGKSFREWGVTLNSPDEEDRALNAIVAMGPRVIPWIQDSLTLELGATNLWARIHERLPGRIASRLPGRPVAWVTKEQAILLLRALEPNGATTVPMLVRYSSGTNQNSFQSLRMLLRLHPPSELIAPQFDEWMNDPNTEKRSAGMIFLTGYPNELRKHVPELIRLFSDTNRWQMAVSLIALCGPAASNTLPNLEEMLAATERKKRATAAYAITQVSPERTSAMAALLAKEMEQATSREQFEIVRYLRALGPAGHPALPSLISRLQSTQQDGFTETVATIGAIGPAARSALGSLQAMAESKAEPPPPAIQRFPIFVKQFNLDRMKRVIDLLIAIARIDLSLEDECGEKLTHLLRPWDKSSRDQSLERIFEDYYDPGRFVFLINLLENKADDLIPSLTITAWKKGVIKPNDLGPVLTRLIERHSKNSPLRKEAEKALRLIAPPGSEKNQ